MAASATGFVLLVPPEYGSRRYGTGSTTGYRRSGVASTIAAAGWNTALGAVERLLLWLPLHGICQSVLWSGLCYDSRCYGVTSTMATAARNMAFGAMEWHLLWRSVLWNDFYYGQRRQECGSRCYGMASITLLPLGIWQSVLWSGLFYSSRCSRMASTMATAARNMAVGAIEWPLLWQSVTWDDFYTATAARNIAVGAMEWPVLWQLVLCNGFCYGYRFPEYDSRCCGGASAIATATSKMALGVVERILLLLPVLCS